MLNKFDIFPLFIVVCSQKEQNGLKEECRIVLAEMSDFLLNATQNSVMHGN